MKVVDDGRSDVTRLVSVAQVTFRALGLGDAWAVLIAAEFRVTCTLYMTSQPDDIATAAVVSPQHSQPSNYE